MAHCETCDKLGFEWCYCDNDKSQVLLNQTQAANRRNVARSTLLKWIKAGLPVIVIAGRKLIRQVDLDNWKPANGRRRIIQLSRQPSFTDNVPTPSAK